VLKVSGSKRAGSEVAWVFVVMVIVLTAITFLSQVTNEGGITGAIVVAPSGNLSCTTVASASCPGGTTKVLGVSNVSNAHAEIPSFSNYSVSVCCNDSSGANTIGNRGGTVFAHLANFSNAHAEIATQSNYGVNVSLNASNAQVSCTVNETGAGSCAPGFGCVVTLSSDSNAHVSNCTGSAYNVTVCCVIGGLTTRYFHPDSGFANLLVANGSINGTLINASVTSYLTQTITYLNLTSGRRFLRFVGSFNTSDVDARALTIEANGTATAVNTSGVVGISANHSIFVSNGSTNAGVIVCPAAKILGQVNDSCSGVLAFQGPFPQTQSGITVTVDGGEYHIDNLASSGAELLVSFNSTLTNCTAANSTFFNSVCTNSNVTNSTVINSTKVDSTVIDSINTGCTVNGSTEVNTICTNSTKTFSTVVDSVNTNCVVVNSTEVGVNCTNSSLTNSTKVFSTVIDSVNNLCTVVGSVEVGTNCNESVLVNSTTNNSNLTNATIVNSTKINATVIDSVDVNCFVQNAVELGVICVDGSITDSIKINSTLVNSVVNQSYNNNCNGANLTEIRSNCSNSIADNTLLVDSNLNGSLSNNSQIRNSTKINSTIILSLVNDSFNLNCILQNSVELNSQCQDSSITNSSVHDSNITNATIINNFCFNGTIVFHNHVFHCPIALSDIYNPQAPHAGGQGGGGMQFASSGGGIGPKVYVMNINPFITPFLFPNDKVLFKIGEKDHSLTVLSVGPNTVKVRVESATRELTIVKGAIASLDLEGDATADITVEMVEVVGNGAKLNMVKPAESLGPVSAPRAPLATAREEVPSGVPSSRGQAITGPIAAPLAGKAIGQGTAVGSSGFLVSSLLVFVALAVVAFMVWNRRARGSQALPGEVQAISEPALHAPSEAVSAPAVVEAPRLPESWPEQEDLLERASRAVKEEEAELKKFQSTFKRVEKLLGAKAKPAKRAKR